MGTESAGYRSIAPAAIIFILGFAFVTAVLPSTAAAQTASYTSVQTQQLIPPGQNSCPAIIATSVQPYVYNEQLESFDVTISDTSDGYVGILSTVGGAAVPLDYITRWAGAPSGLRIHVDVNDVPVGSMLPVSLTLLSSLPNQPTCITSISFDVSGSGTITSYTSPANAGGTGATQTSTGNSAGTTAVSYPTGGNSSTGSAQSAGSGAQVSSSTATSSLGATVASAGNAGFLNYVCSGSNAYRLWFILLLIYILIVAIVVFAEPWFLETSVLGSTAAILVPLILLLIFWYFSEICRAASWIPVIACVIAIVGLFLTFREYELPPLLPAPSEH